MKKNNFFKKLNKKYKVSVINEKTFEDVLNLRTSKMSVLIFFIVFILFISGSIIFLICYTDAKELIPGFDRNMRKKIVQNAITVDSLKNELEKRDVFFESIRKVLNENNDSQQKRAGTQTDKQQDTSDIKNYEINFNKSPAEEEFREQIENEERFNLSFSTNSKQENIKFFPPVLGLISQKFDALHEHYGIDIVAKPNSKISAVLDGTVVFTGWTIKTGHVIQIQHANNIISTYKHNVELLKKMGQRVKAGEAIAIIGNTGEITSSTHLHFELWKDGKPINPEYYIKFK